MNFLHEDKTNFLHSMNTIDMKKKKIILNFKNGTSVELTEKTDMISMWEALDSILIEQWLTKDEFKKLYPGVKTE